MSAILLLLGMSFALGVVAFGATGSDDSDDQPEERDDTGRDGRDGSDGDGDIGGGDGGNTDGDGDDGDDTGATLTTRDDGTVEVTLGADETGSLVLFSYEDTEDAGTGLSGAYEARLYLAPAGTTIPTSVGDGAFADLAALETALGLQLLETWDLGTTLSQPDGTETDNRILPPSIVSEDPIALYDVRANTDGDDIVSIDADSNILPFEPGSVFGLTGVPGPNGGQNFFETDGNFLGSEGDDTISSIALDPTRITMNGAGGDDVISGGDNDVIRGGAGADTLFVDVNPYDARFAADARGQIDMSDAADSLVVRLPPPEQGAVWRLVIDTSDANDPADMPGDIVSEGGFEMIVQAAPGAGPFTPAEIEAFAVFNTLTPGLSLVAEIGYGLRTGVVQTDGSILWGAESHNPDPDITYVGTLAGTLSITL